MEDNSDRSNLKSEKYPILIYTELYTVLRIGQRYFPGPERQGVISNN